MKIEKLFKHDAEEKELISKISALCGLKQDIIKQVWQYTFFSTYISLLEQKDRPISEIKIPYLGKIMLRFKENEPEFERFLLIEEEVQEIIKNIRNGDDTELVQFFQENFINKVLNNILEG